MNNDISQADHRLGKSRYILFPLIALSIVVTIYIFEAMIINALPRPSMGESVIVPLPVCLAVSFIAQITMSFIISKLFIKNPKSKKLILFWMIFFIILIFLFGFAAVAEKAWRRGL